MTRPPGRMTSLLARLGHENQDNRDRGSVSLWVVMFAFVTLALLILVVDGGQVIVAKSRAAADDIDPGALRNGDVAIAAGACGTPGPASELVSTYQKGVGVTATMLTCTPGTGPGGAPDVTVAVQVSMKPFLPVNPFGTITVTATETAFLACGTADARVAC